MGTETGRLNMWKWATVLLLDREQPFCFNAINFIDTLLGLVARMRFIFDSRSGNFNSRP